jgi:cytochrome P450
MSQTPIHLAGFSAARFGWQFLRDPIAAMRRNHAEFGPFIVVSNALPFVNGPKLPMLGLPLILTAGPEFNDEVLSNPATWRPASIFPGGPRNSAARRLGAGLARMTGRRHAHYRHMVVSPLRKPNLDVMADKLFRLAEAEIAGWPIGETIDLWARVRHLMHTFAIGLLFGNDKTHGHPVADMITNLLTRNWSPGVRVCPINLPFTPYGQFLRASETLEHCILDWAEKKRGHLDGDDLLSIVVNNPEEDGEPIRAATIVGLMPQLFGAVFETCQIALMWTLILIEQHPHFAHDLFEELRYRLAGAPPTLRSIAELPRLDAVIKESLRLLPPVPMQLRVAQQDTALAGYPVPKGGRVLLSAFMTNRLPELYPEPNSFQPERWASINPTPFEYLVFSGGPRNCPGFWLAMAMLKVALATILTQYRVELAQDQRIDYWAQPALVTRGKVWANLRRQDAKFSAAPIGGSIFHLVGTLQ